MMLNITERERIAMGFTYLTPRPKIAIFISDDEGLVV